MENPMNNKEDILENDEYLNEFMDLIFNKEDFFIGLKFSIEEVIRDISYETLESIALTDFLITGKFENENLPNPVSNFMVINELRKLLSFLNKQNTRIVLDTIYSYDSLTRSQLFNYLSIFYNDVNINSKLAYMTFMRDPTKDN